MFSIVSIISILLILLQYLLILFALALICSYFPKVLRRKGGCWFKSFLYKKRHFSSGQFSHSVVSNSLWPHGLPHTRPPCPSPTPGVYSNKCPLSPWCHPTISSFVILFSCLQSFPASGSFPMNQFFSSGGQSIWSFSFNLSPSNEHPGLISFRLDWLDLLVVQGTLKSLL